MFIPTEDYHANYLAARFKNNGVIGRHLVHTLDQLYGPSVTDVVFHDLIVQLSNSAFREGRGCRIGLIIPCLLPMASFTSDSRAHMTNSLYSFINVGRLGDYFPGGAKIFRRALDVRDARGRSHHTERYNFLPRGWTRKDSLWAVQKIRVEGWNLLDLSFQERPSVAKVEPASSTLRGAPAYTATTTLEAPGGLTLAEAQHQYVSEVLNQLGTVINVINPV